MAKRDYYEVLGVERDASDNAIKGAYRKKALKYHPDRNPGDAAAEEQFKEASEAYEVLSDPEKKAAYDRFGHAGIKGDFGSGGFQWTDFTHAGDFQDIFGDIFESFFGGGSAVARDGKGNERPRLEDQGGFDPRGNRHGRRKEHRADPLAALQKLRGNWRG